MSLGGAAQTFVISGVDVLAGLGCSTLVELVAPPISDQGPLRLLFEGLVQIGAVTLVSLEVAQLIQQYQEDPTHGMPFAWGVYIGMPNTIAKLGLSGRWLQRVIGSAFVSAPAPAQMDTGTA